MSSPIALSPQFLADLDLVCLKTSDELPSHFLADLESAYAHAVIVRAQQPAITVAELTELEAVFKEWRSHHQRLLQEYLTQLPEDDPLLSPAEPRSHR
jgi:hypothetical protein